THAISSAAKGVAKGVTKGVSTVTKEVAKGGLYAAKGVKAGAKGLGAAAKGLGKGVIWIGKKAIDLATLGPIRRLIWGYINKNGVPKLAQQRANYLVWQQSKGKQRVATPDQVKKLGVPWATANFKSRMPKFLVSGDVPDHAVVRCRR